MNPDFRDMLSALSEEGVDYLLVGAYAVAAHGHPRYTGDIDFWIRPTPDNAQRLLKALTSFGAPLFDLGVQDLTTPGMVFQIGLPPARIDFLTSLADIDFSEAWERRLRAGIEGLEVAVLGREDLIRAKRVAGRPKDLADLASLEQFPPPQ